MKSPIFENAEFTLFPDSVVQKNGWGAELANHYSVHVWGPNGDKDYAVDSLQDDQIRYAGTIPALEAVYNLTMTEFLRSRKDSGVLSTGASWGTVWTRDVSYGTHLSLGMVDPAICMASLRERVQRGEIVQDTGTGGAWPISTDRIVWGIAAWELYLVTGDKDWLEWATDVVEKTCSHDLQVVEDMSGLMRGESSFLDWRSQSYPDWMTPADIGESISLTTVVLHAQVRKLLAFMWKELGDCDRSAFWKTSSEKLVNIMESMFRIPHHPQYGQFLYGRGFPVLSEKQDSLGTLLAILFGIPSANDSEDFLKQIPRYSFGIPCFHPQKQTDELPYHNGASWPFVEGYYSQVASLLGNEDALAASLSALVRTVLVNGTNKENINLWTGNSNGLVQSSDCQLWSIAGTLGAFYKGLFGIHPDPQAISFAPCIPEQFAGEHKLLGIKYRNLSFDLTIRGHGNQIGKCLVNGRIALPVLDAQMSGHFEITIEIIPGDRSANGVNWTDIEYDLAIPQWGTAGNGLCWEHVPGAGLYRIYRNGIPIAQTEKTSYTPRPEAGVSQYQVMAVSLDGKESFLNSPREYIPSDCRVETRPCGLSGDDVWISRQNGSKHAYFYDVILPKTGVYRIDAFFSNGTGDFKDGNTCALRSLLLNGTRVGSLAFPHMSSQGNWGDFFYTPGLDVALVAGTYTVELSYAPQDGNTNYLVNDAMIKHLRFTRIFNS